MSIHRAVSGKHSWFAGNLQFHFQLHNIKIQVHFLQADSTLVLKACASYLQAKMQGTSWKVTAHHWPNTHSLTFLRILSSSITQMHSIGLCEEAGVPRQHANYKQKISLSLGNSKLEPSCCDPTGLACLLNLQTYGLFFYMYHSVWSS